LQRRRGFRRVSHGQVFQHSFERVCRPRKGGKIALLVLGPAPSPDSRGHPGGKSPEGPAGIPGLLPAAPEVRSGPNGRAMASHTLHKVTNPHTRTKGPGENECTADTIFHVNSIDFCEGRRTYRIRIF